MVRAWFQILCLSAAVTVAGCTSLPYKRPVVEAMAPTIGASAGLRDLAPGKPLKVLVVHGMCSHDFGWVQKWTAAMGDAFGAPGVQRPSDPVGVIQTARFDFHDAGRPVEVTFAIWSPATTNAKQILDYDSSPAFPYKRAKFNDQAKSSLINDCFADPIIYSGSLASGTIGHAIRHDMTGVVCAFLGGQWRAGACTGSEDGTDRAFITESLGSKLLFDAVNRLAEDGEASSMRRALARTQAIYMLANQLPLLRLAEEPLGVRTASAKSELRWFGPATVSGLNGANLASRLQLVAFTDPNDQFTYRLTYKALGEDPARVGLFNVIVSNAKTYLGLAENPYPAHIGYWQNAEVRKLVLQGGARLR